MGGADVQERRTRVWVPPVDPSCVHEARSVGRVPRAAQHAGVGRIERRATIDERHDVVERQVPRWMRRMLGTIARADVAVLADVAGDHPLGQAGPSRVRMDVMVGTDAREPRVLAAPTPWSARDDATDDAELHPTRAGDLAARLTLVTLDCRPFDIATSVGRVDGAVYSPTVLRLGDQALGSLHAPRRRGAGDLQRARSNSWSSPTSATCVCSPAALAMMPTAMSREGWIAAKQRKVPPLPACTLVVAPSNIWTPQPHA